ncbi:MAG TPA: dihydrofolate reductase family protein [Leptospiraceae bacterium]|nr:dihydrofolate reductase family protein [Leptospiraceae bacterium]HMW08405.1 dihydrofolate reductase family protein [Leptospiraceae bacterium]HMX33687.1 dihydrofolate reductase family protein [Leptospiraceae bacterium]HMY34098.1 dihydrofolate reductase family protein [Leptospiraceae bacterium]HMZ65962.1 dihydrofolate reductase family protein [Leptospiraceae bacterium]
MSKLKVLCFGVSTDGYGAGPNQSLENPMGEGGMALHEWVFHTNEFQKMHGEMEGGIPKVSGSFGIDNDFAKRGFENIGSWILGRYMFGPSRGPWKKEDDWKGWWGPNPPYHTSVYILTHHPKDPIVMEGGTTFYFVTEGIEKALELAKKAANGKDVRLGGGANTVRQYLKAGLVDELHLAIAPALLGSGETLLKGINLPELGYRITEFVNSEKATHVVFKK